ncbi:MAG TPA: TIGR03086 family metal-binding protein [Acidimicrobiales bacterium]
MSTATLERAFGVTRSVLVNVSRDQLGDATPCASWDVKALINHIVGGTYWFAASMAGDSGSGGELPDLAAGDFVAAFDEGVAKAVAAFGEEGALAKMVTLPFGTMPGGAFMGIATTDTFTHAWDLARATGQDASGLDPELATQLLAGAKLAIADGFRGPDGKAPFGAQAEAPEGASPADELAAFLGRSV